MDIDEMLKWLLISIYECHFLCTGVRVCGGTEQRSYRIFLFDTDLTLILGYVILSADV